ncbi:MAG: hypothetical protein COA97_01075 [Flavobacteriales bacterium]|nr:MAG: hypothetical protein COA97_01075 [Flavobacteriales bacterium]
MNGFHRTYFEIIQSIESAIKDRKIITSLILLYSAIDSFSNIANQSNKSGRKVFIKWVDKWMLEENNLTCNSIDIYAARCGVLHGFISESDLSNNGNAKKICYAWGNASLLELESSIKKTKKENEYIALKLEDIFQSFRIGMANCIDEIEKDENWRNSFELKASKYFTTSPSGTNS